MTRRGAVAQAAGGAVPAWFAMVMATGIMSAALRRAGLPDPGLALLAVAAAAFVVVTAAVGWRAAGGAAGLRGELSRPDRAFTGFAAVAGCGVLGSGLAGDGQPIAAAVLAGTALVVWLALTWRILWCLGAWRRGSITGADGTWYLWTVGTQALAIAAAFLHAGGLLRARPAAVAGLVAWSAGALLYLVVMAVVLARLLLAGPGPGLAPYWVAMGAASISALAAASLVPVAAAAAPGARLVITDGGIAAWALATVLIPPLAVLTVARLPRPIRPRYGTGGWVFVFPLGMYATAGLVLGAAAHVPLIRHIGAVAVWPAAAAWALTAAAMAAAAARTARLGGRAEPEATGPAAASPQPQDSTGDEMKRYKYQARVTLLPDHGGTLPAATTRMVIKAEHRQTHASKLFSSLVTIDDAVAPRNAGVTVTFVVLGDDAGDYLATGERFALWNGHELGLGVITRRIFV